MTATARLYRRGQWQMDEDGHESCVDVWEVRTDSETETLTDVLAASGLPVYGDSHEEKANAFYNGDANGDHDGEVLTLWYLNYRYSTKIKTRERGPFDEQRTKGGMKSGSKQVPAFYDARGYPLVNTAGDVYEGMTRKRRLRIFNCTHNFDDVPNWFFELADTINNAAVTILGQTYPIGTCMLTDIDMPDEPSRDNDENYYWPVTFQIQHDPDGYFLMLPNKGLHELVYQTRPSSSGDWVDWPTVPSSPAPHAVSSDKPSYDAKTPTTDRRIIKRRIQTDEQQDVADNIWLNAYGQAVKVNSFTATQLGTGSMTDGSALLTLASGTLSADTHTGALVRVQGAGPLGRWLDTRIDSVLSASTATLAASARTNSTGAAVWVSGAIVNYFVMEDLADWSDVPLPDNEP